MARPPCSASSNPRQVALEGCHGSFTARPHAGKDRVGQDVLAQPEMQLFPEHRFGVDQLRGDPQGIAGATHASLQHMAHRQFAGDGANAQALLPLVAAG
jgi:hypothetical protein